MSIGVTFISVTEPPMISGIGDGGIGSIVVFEHEARAEIKKIITIKGGIGFKGLRLNLP